MKKLLASVLCLTLAMSVAACSTNAPEQTSEPTTTAATAETTTEPSKKPAETTKATEATETTEATSVSQSEDTSASSADKKTNPAMAYIQEKVEIGYLSASYVDPASYVDDEGEEVKFHFPKLLIESSYADKVNKEISGKVEKYKKDLEIDDSDLFIGSTYAAFLTKDVLSLVFVSYHVWDCNEYKVYNIDVKTGEKVDNARIAEIAGVSSIRKAAMDALQKYYNDREWIKLENYKVVLEPGQKKDDQMKDVERMFSEKYLNDKMQIGLTDEGKMFFITTVDEMAGADYYEHVFDVNGYDLDEEANTFVPFDAGDDEDYDVEEDDWTDEGEDAEEA